MYNQAFPFSVADRTDRTQSIIFSAPSHDPATISVRFFYSPSARGPYVALIVAIILKQRDSCFITSEQKKKRLGESERGKGMHFNIKLHSNKLMV